MVDAETALLRSRGHQVTLALKDNRDIHGPLEAVRTGLGTWHAHGAQHELRHLVRTHRPDVVHVHNWFPQWSPSVFQTCKSEGIPIVATLHNFRLACPAGTFFRDGQPCESCLPRRFALPALVRRCYRNSAIQSAVVAGATGLHRMLGTWRDAVDAYIALTAFQRDKLASWGLPRDRMHVVHNFHDGPLALGETTKDNDVLFVGRLAPEKGLEVLMKGFLGLSGKATLTIAGDGPLKEWVRARCEASDGRIRYIGRLTSAEVSHWMARSRVLAFPSQWYEGQPLTLLEAMAHGLPVVASRIGSLPELVRENETGWLVTPTDPDAWTQAIGNALSLDEATAAPYRATARRAYLEHYAPEVHYQALMQIYRHVSRARDRA